MEEFKLYLTQVLDCTSTKDKDSKDRGEEIRLIMREIKDQQIVWGEVLVEIGKLHGKKSKEEIKKVAMILLYPLYDRGNIVSFKPTLATYPHHFRHSMEEVLSYFIGLKYGDKGFALQPWESVDFDNKTMHLFDGAAVTTGVYTFKDYNDETTSAEFTFVYTRAKEDNRWKIVVHHSSLHHTPDDLL